MNTSKEMIEKIREIVVDAAGPIGDFVIKKQIKDLGYTPDNFPAERIQILIEKVVENAVYDPEKKMEVKNKLRKILILQSSEKGQR